MNFQLMFPRKFPEIWLKNFHEKKKKEHREKT